MDGSVGVSVGGEWVMQGMSTFKSKELRNFGSPNAAIQSVSMPNENGLKRMPNKQIKIFFRLFAVFWPAPLK